MFMWRLKKNLTRVKNNMEMENSKQTEIVNFFRPKTVRELLEALKKGVKCEVVASVMEITNIKLDGWLKFEGKYQTYLSNNIGWVIYESV